MSLDAKVAAIEAAERAKVEQRERKVARQRLLDGAPRCGARTRAGTSCARPATPGSEHCAAHTLDRICGLPLGRDKVCHQLKVPGSDTCWAHDPENVCAEEGCDGQLWTPRAYQVDTVGYRLSRWCERHDPVSRAERAAQRERERQYFDERAAEDERRNRAHRWVGDVADSLGGCKTCIPTLVSDLFFANDYGHGWEREERLRTQFLTGMVGYHHSGHLGARPDLAAMTQGVAA